MTQILTLPYPTRRDEVIRFVKKHHYTRRCPYVWSCAYGIENSQGKIQAVAIYGPAPYPTVARAFVRNQQHVNKHIWQARMVGAGITSDELDKLIAHANADLLAQGYWWVHTLTDPTSKVIDAPLRLVCRGYTGEVYHRTGALFLGTAGSKALAGFLIDGKPVHHRQGSITLTLTNVHEHYPNASSIRALYGNTKHRWAYVLAKTDMQREQRLLLMAYRPQEYNIARQPRLLIDIYHWLLLMMWRQKRT